MITFSFELSPVDSIAQDHLRVGSAGLSWFWLTFGCYRIELGDHHLLRYSDECLARWRADSGAEDVPAVVDYQVARLWEDLIEAIPAVNEPVPADLADFIASDHADWVADDSDEADAATSWYGRHALDLSYLVSPPSIRWWRRVADDDTVTVVWRHPPHDEVAWAAPERGRVTMPTSDFLAGVRHLDAELLAAMQRRVAELERSGPPPGIHIDMDHLRFEQRDRATWLQRALDRPADADADKVRIGARRLLTSPRVDGDRT